MGKSHWHYPSGGAAYSTLIIFYALIFSATGINLSPCGFDDTVELQDNRSDNTVKCSGIPDDFVVDWLLALPSRPSPDNVGTCNVGSTTCSDLSAIGYLATRPSANTSVMTINPTKNVNFVKNGTLECKASKAGQQNQEKSCRLDIITPSTNVACSVRPEDNALNVIGSCNVSKVYSYHGRYSCQWYRKNGSEAEEAVGHPVAMQTALTADVTPSNGIYVDGFCDIIMPSPSVNTSYRAVIYPGARSEDAGFIYNVHSTTNIAMNSAASQSESSTTDITATQKNLSSTIGPTTPQNKSKPDSSNDNRNIKIYVGFAVGAAVLVVVGIFCYVRFRRCKSKNENPSEQENDMFKTRPAKTNTSHL